jgi:hypothetical protein
VQGKVKSAALAVAARLDRPAGRAASSGPAAALCGVERWRPKTLQDRPRLLPARRTTLAYLDSRPEPAHLPYTRLPFERHIFRVTAAVTIKRPEADGDFHLVLVSGRAHLIAETPAAACTGRRNPAQAPPCPFQPRRLRRSCFGGRIAYASSSDRTSRSRSRPSSGTATPSCASAFSTSIGTRRSSSARACMVERSRSRMSIGSSRLVFALRCRYARCRQAAEQ